MDKYKVNDVWVFAEQIKGKLRKESVKILSSGFKLAKELNTELTAVLFGNKVENLAKNLIEYGANIVFLADSPPLELYQSDLYTKIFSNLIEKEKPAIVLFPATSIGKDLAARVAAKVKTGLVSHCVDFYVNETGELVHIVPCFEAIMAKVVNSGRPKIITTKVEIGKKGREEKEKRRNGRIIRLELNIKEEDMKAKAVEIIKEERKEGENVENAKAIVAGGWGLVSAGGFELVKKLADALEASIGGTRPAVDEGWIEEERMIGQSGKIVRPELYVALGISGAAQHIVGMVDSKVMLAINKDEKAPIFDFCDIGIVGEVKEIVPLLLEELKRKVFS